MSDTDATGDDGRGAPAGTAGSDGEEGLEVEAVEADTRLGRSKGRALVTGASRGIGYELARLFAGTGFDVVLVARSGDTLRDHASRFREQFGVRADVVTADLSEPDAGERVYDTCRDRDLPVTVLVNNAGLGTGGRFVGTDRERELDSVAVNVAAVTDLTKLFLPAMVDRGAGGVLNVASLAGFAPGPGEAVYAATKAYVVSFTEAVAREVRPEGVSVTCLCPGPVETPFHERAGTEDNRRNLFQKKPRPVARAGYRGLMRGEVVVVPGAVPKLLYYSSRVAPRPLARRVAAFLNG